MEKSLYQKRQESREANQTALCRLQMAITLLNEALAGVRHCTALNHIGDALKTARQAENLLVGE